MWVRSDKIFSRFLVRSFSSWRVASCLIALARLLITNTFPGTYPSAGISLSKDGEFGPVFPLPRRRGVLRSGHRSGITMSLRVIVQGYPPRLALPLALLIIILSFMLLRLYAQLTFLFELIRALFASQYTFRDFFSFSVSFLPVVPVLELPVEWAAEFEVCPGFFDCLWCKFSNSLLISMFNKTLRLIMAVNNLLHVR